jgi:hypothetical protein
MNTAGTCAERQREREGGRERERENERERDNTAFFEMNTTGT